MTSSIVQIDRVDRTVHSTIPAIEFLIGYTETYTRWRRILRTCWGSVIRVGACSLYED